MYMASDKHTVNQKWLVSTNTVSMWSLFSCLQTPVSMWCHNVTLTLIEIQCNSVRKLSISEDRPCRSHRCPTDTNHKMLFLTHLDLNGTRIYLNIKLKVQINHVKPFHYFLGIAPFRTYLGCSWIDGTLVVERGNWPRSLLNMWPVLQIIWPVSLLKTWC